MTLFDGQVHQIEGLEIEGDVRFLVHQRFDALEVSALDSAVQERGALGIYRIEIPRCRLLRDVRQIFHDGPCFLWKQLAEPLALRRGVRICACKREQMRATE